MAPQPAWAIMKRMNGMKTAILLAALAALLIFIGGAFGGQGGVVVAFFIAVAVNVGSYWFSDKIVLRMHRAAEVGGTTALPHDAAARPEGAVCRCRRST